MSTASASPTPDDQEMTPVAEIAPPAKPLVAACQYNVLITKCIEKTRSLCIDFTVTSEFGGTMQISHLLKGNSGWKKMSPTERVHACWAAVEGPVFEWLQNQSQLAGMNFDPSSGTLSRP